MKTNINCSYALLRNRSLLRNSALVSRQKWAGFFMASGLIAILQTGGALAQSTQTQSSGTTALKPATGSAVVTESKPASEALDSASGAQKSAAATFQRKLDAVSTMTGKFSQLLVDSTGKTVQESQGSFMIKRPGLFRWETLPPFEQLVVSGEDSVYVYDPDLEQVTVSTQQQTEGSPASILSGDLATLEKYYLIKSKKLDDGQEAFALTSRSGSVDFASVLFRFSGNVLSSLEVVDRAGQTSRITFEEVKINRLLDAQNFQFSPPEGVDVIRQ